MKRQPPEFSEVKLLSLRTPLLELDLKVVTPMFGGSDTPGEVDPDLPVRGSTVRGHLRFWWRACVGHTFESAADLFAEEARLWGTTVKEQSPGGPSAVEIEVETQDPQQIKIRPCAYYQDRPGKAPELRWLISDTTNRDGSKGDPYDPLGYALFPFRGEMKNKRVIRQPSEMAEGVSFRLRIFRSPSKSSLDDASLRRQVEAAVWAWITFGGIGARTRRGCGTLWTNHPDFCPPAGTPVKQWLEQRARQYLAGDAVATPLPIPRLKGATVLVRQQPNEATRVWREAVNWLRSYRQQRAGGATGRSLWPEANAIRALTGRSARGAPPPETPRYFPRGELGLPIIFHFIDAEYGDPKEHTLDVDMDGTSRFASPFAIKPLCFAGANGEVSAFPMILRFNEPTLHEILDEFQVSLRLSEKQESGPGRKVASLSANNVYDPTKAPKVPPLSSINQTNAVDGFIEFVKEKRGFQEVKLG